MFRYLEGLSSLKKAVALDPTNEALRGDFEEAMTTAMAQGEGIFANMGNDGGYDEELIRALSEASVSEVDLSDVGSTTASTTSSPRSDKQQRSAGSMDQGTGTPKGTPNKRAKHGLTSDHSGSQQATAANVAPGSAEREHIAGQAASISSAPNASGSNLPLSPALTSLIHVEGSKSKAKSTKKSVGAAGISNKGKLKDLHEESAGGKPIAGTSM